MDNSITIRRETPYDFLQVDKIIRTAFFNMEDSDHSEHLLVERLRSSDTFVPELSLVAVTGDGKIAGHILLSEVKVISGDTEHTVLALAPLSVLPEFQGKGIGGMLVREGHRRAAELGYGAAVVLGHEGYYPRFGYRRASLYGIRFPFDAPDECCMAAELTDGGLDGIHGMVQYPDAFISAGDM